MNPTEPTSSHQLRHLLCIAALLLVIASTLVLTVHTMAQVLGTLSRGFDNTMTAAGLDAVLYAGW